MKTWPFLYFKLVSDVPITFCKRVTFTNSAFGNVAFLMWSGHFWAISDHVICHLLCNHRQWPWYLQWKVKLTHRYVWIKQDNNLVQKCVCKGDWFKSHFCWICLFDAVCRPDLSISDLILDRKVAPLWSIHISFYIPVCSGVYNTVATLGHIFTALRRL